MSNVHQYRIYCNEEGCFVTGYGTTAPTVCYNNMGHDVNVLSIQDFGETNTNHVVIQEEWVPTGGHYAAQSYQFDITTDSVQTFDRSMPIPISMMTARIQVTSNNIGDTINFIMGPNTTVGVLTVGANSGDHILHVNSTVTTNSYIGLDVNLYASSTITRLGMITAIDKVGGTITVETAIPSSFSAGTTLVQVGRKTIKDFYVYQPGLHVFGASKIGASYVPAGTIGRVVYTNVNGQAKKLSFTIEYLY